MALKKCKECGHEISKKTKTCPNCGSPAGPRQYGCGTLILVVLVLGFLGSMLSNQSSGPTSSSSTTTKTEDQAAMKARVHGKLKTELKQNREGVISEIIELIAKGDFGLAYRKADRFREFEDAELKELASQAWEKHRKQEEKRIIAKLKGIPATQYQANINEYAKLAKLFPENERYKQKLSHYRGKLAAEKKRESQEREQRLAKFGEPPKQSGWDGSYFEVKQYLRKVANDPDSIDIDGCTEVYHTKNGWLVGCDYRGRNAFGGMVRNSNWFTIRHGRVVNMEESSAYKP